MAAKHSFAEFDPSLEDWNSYSERFDFYLEAGRIEDPAIQLSTFLSSVGPGGLPLTSSFAICAVQSHPRP